MVYSKRKLKKVSKIQYQNSENFWWQIQNKKKYNSLKVIDSFFYRKITILILSEMKNEFVKLTCLLFKLYFCDLLWI